MPTAAELKPFLQQRYDRAAWLPVLRQLLGRERVEFFAQPQPIQNPDADRVAAAVQLGYADVGEATLFGASQRLAVVEVTLKAETTDIARNRVGLRALTYPFIDNAATHGLLVFYHDPGQPDYRLSFQTRAEHRAGSAGAAERRRYTFVLGPREAATTAAQRLAGLGEQAGRATLADLRKTFSVEQLSKDFFSDYRRFYEAFTEHLYRQYRPEFATLVNLEENASAALRRAAEEKLMRDYTKRLLGRLVFLHFLQKKGWMGCPPATGEAAPWEGGDPEFLLNLFRQFSQNTPERFHSQCLTELFFNTLNQPRPDNRFFVPGMVAPCRVPYLNGGLFDEDTPNGRSIDFPDTLFESVLLFFGRYNFTIEENRPDDHDVGIDPEMLGHIFENLLEENRARGAIYTPRAIVRHMAQESLIAYLEQQFAHVPAAGARPALARFVRAPHEGLPAPLRPYAADLDRYLREVTICDPAIGSGAFPIGLLQELFAARLYLYPYLPDHQRPPFVPAAVKEHIIHHNIYGVDVDEGAVGIARLRFWLALVVDADRPVLLPNLDYKVMQGDSLLESFEGIDFSDLTAQAATGPDDTVLLVEKGQFELGAEFSKRRQPLLVFTGKQRTDLLREIEDYFAAGSADKKSLRSTIGDTVDSWLRAVVGQARLQAGAELAAYEAELRGQLGPHFAQALAARPRSVQAQRHRQRAQAVAEATEREQRLMKVQHSTDRPYFLWHLYFKNVFDRGGFDIVIANPPYMRVQTSQLSLAAQKTAYETAYEPVAKGAYDLANLFVYLAVERLLNARGTACFIFPHKFFNAAGAEAFRGWLLQGQYVSRVAHFGSNRVFNAADTYVAVALLGRRRHEQLQLLKLPPNTDPATYDAVLPQDEKYQTVTYEQIRQSAAYYGSPSPWILLDSVSEYDLFESFYKHGAKRLQDIVNIFAGLQTSHDKLYVLTLDDEQPIDTNLYRGYNELNPNIKWEVEKKYWKPLLKGRDVQRFGKLESRSIVFFPYEFDSSLRTSKVPTLEELRTNNKSTYEYLIKYEAEFKNREKGKASKLANWYEYLYPRNTDELLAERPRIVNMEICTSHPNVAFNPGGFYPVTTVYTWIKYPDTDESYDYILALANSRVMWWFQKRTGDTLQGDARRMKSNYLNPFPLPPTPAPPHAAAVEALVRAQRWLHDADYAATPAVLGLTNGTVAAYFQQVLDLAVCELYPVLAERMRAREVNVLDLVAHDVEPLRGQDPLTPEAIGAVYTAWQQPASAVRNRQLLATTRVPEWLGAIFGA
ncbi:Eco57I restriction-modification methylase domain-containing protein [Hymenobacter chitinivorans]|uniref:Eco57I restriction-modification methylase domain-containing protein n=1 Tax=Hymenobacter chitinivorans TaxID=89969 RepID=UPI0012FE564A|nr:Eco57I restriction-modification methylase domain-containing protein [Hymenobacter chitinivorans]